MVQRVHMDDDLTWDQVDVAGTSSSSLLHRNQPRRGPGVQSDGIFYTRRAPEIVDEDPYMCDDEHVDDDEVEVEDPSSHGGGGDNEVGEDNSNALELDADDI